MIVFSKMNFFLIAERVRKLPFFFSPLCFLSSGGKRGGAGGGGGLFNSDILKL